MAEPEYRIGEEALERIMPEARAIEPALVEHTNVTGARAVAVAQAYAAKLPADLARMQGVFAQPPVAGANVLVDQAFAFWAAERRLERLVVEDVPDLPARYLEAGRLKRRAVGVLEIVAGDDPVVQKVLDQVRPGAGYADRAIDLADLYPLLDARRDDLVERRLLTGEQIDRVAQLAAVLLRRGDDTQEVRAGRDLRDRCWTLFIGTYRTLRRHLSFLYGDDTAGLEAYPNLYGDGRGRRPQSSATETPEGE